ncbi:hypothetical protein DL546_000533 [Coniochaeta pulveracea]|uniref:Transcription factor domain-containing protein n=1 Tax=Coniochaeta pulveracea TaxID=177199 RepID=A0A420XWI7_9PEZI|nr:hypothetical protein DL546_000533 [Coniochaeta pulveracea]
MKYSISPILRSSHIQCAGKAPCNACLRLRAACTFLNPVLPKGPVPKHRRHPLRNARTTASSDAMDRSGHKRRKTKSRPRISSRRVASRNSRPDVKSRGRLNSAASPGPSATTPLASTSDLEVSIDSFFVRPCYLSLERGFEQSLNHPAREVQIGTTSTGQNQEEVPNAGSDGEVVMAEQNALDWLTFDCADDVPPMQSPARHYSPTSTGSLPELISSAPADVELGGGELARDQPLDQITSSLPQSQSQPPSDTLCKNDAPALDFRLPADWPLDARSTTSIAPSTSLASRPASPSLPFIFDFLPLSNAELACQSTPVPSEEQQQQQSIVQSQLQLSSFHLPRPQGSYVPHPSPLFVLSLDTLIIPRLQAYYDSIYPMIPVLPATAIFSHLPSRAHQYPWSTDRTRDPSFLALVLSMAALASVHPLLPHEVPFRQQYVDQAVVMLDEAGRLNTSWSYDCQPSIESILTQYLAFGTLLELGFEDGARVRLRQAVAMGDAMQLGDMSAYLNVSREEQRRRLGIFWVLSVTERAYTLQRSGRILFNLSLYKEHSTMVVSVDPGLRHLRFLARLFSYIDSDLVSCWHGDCQLDSGCQVLTHRKAESILASLSQPADDLFHGYKELEETQQADLVVTWQWLRNRVWGLAQRHGLVHIAGCEGFSVGWELGPDYPIDVALTTAGFCRDFAFRSMEAHGAGFVEKLYNIASTVTVLMRTSSGPMMTGRLAELALTSQWPKVLQELTFFVRRHHKGYRFAGSLSHEIGSVATNVLSTRLEIDLR